MTLDATDALTTRAVEKDEGEARWWFDGLALIKVTAADTDGHMTIVEMRQPPGAQAPLHVHYREDEAFFVLEGSATIQVGDETFEASAGDYVFGPRGVPHKYKLGPEGCRMLFICTPGGFENLVREMSVPAERRTLPPPSDEEPDWEHVAAVANANGCELLA